MGMASLPFRTSVEIEVILEIRPSLQAAASSTAFRYEDLGVAGLVNAMGTMTALGGSRMAPEVLAAMAEAASRFVDMTALLAAAGAEAARLCRAPDGRLVLPGNFKGT